MNYLSETFTAAGIEQAEIREWLSTALEGFETLKGTFPGLSERQSLRVAPKSCNIQTSGLEIKLGRMILTK